MRNCSFLSLLDVGSTYSRLVYTWYKNSFHMIAVLIVFLAANKKKESDEKNTKTRQQRDIDEKLLLLATQYQVKSTQKTTRPEQDIYNTGKKDLKISTK